MMFLLWSFEHQAYWRPHGNGYTKNKFEAGRYTHDAAVKECLDANGHLPVPDEAMVPVVDEVTP